MKRGIITINNGVVGISTAPVWVTQEKIAYLFNVYGHDVRKFVNAILKRVYCKKLKQCDTSGLMSNEVYMLSH